MYEYVMKPNGVFIHLKKCVYFIVKAEKFIKKWIQFPYYGLQMSIFVKIFDIYLVTESLEEIKQSILNTEEIDWNTFKNWIERDKFASEFPH